MSSEEIFQILRGNGRKRYEARSGDEFFRVFRAFTDVDEANLSVFEHFKGALGRECGKHGISSVGWWKRGERIVGVLTLFRIVSLKT